MKTWTESAKDRLESYLRERVLREKLDPEDAAEVVEDWRLHVHEEIERQPGSVVNAEMLETVLGRLGQNEQPREEWEPYRPPQAASLARKERVAAGAGFWGWLIGVFLPASVIVFEAMVGFCESVFFDPIPTWIHFVLLAAVPVGNAWLLSRLGRGGAHRVMPALCGFVVVVSAFYALLFVPLIPASVLALVVFGLGLLSLVPLLTWGATWLIGRRTRERHGAQLNWKRGWWYGAAGAFALLIALEAGPFVTRIGLARAMSDNAEKASAGLAQLRSFHVQSTLLRACYEGNRGTTMATDISGWLMRGWQIPLTMIGSGVMVNHDSDRARDLFYRVTGKPFNSLRPPAWVTGQHWVSRGAAWEDVEFDSHLGGDEVAVRIRGLSMSQSRIDAHLDRASDLGYLEWAAEFTNRSEVAREARFQVMLPEDGVVSRVTLWVNGEPREAAFASKSRVKAAYQEVAVQQRRDPVLVTACGPGRVMVQCFPVPADGGRMKVRLGMTAPLKDGRLAMPVILEQNFAMESGLEHAVWVQSDDPFRWSAAKDESRPDGPGHSLQVSLSAGELNQDRWYARLKEATPVKKVWCEDRFAEPGERRLARVWEMVDRPGLDRCVVVLDGSAAMRPHRAALAEALNSLGGDSDLRILLATDQWRELDPGEVGSIAFSGGRDNVPALAEALQHARGEGVGAVVWIHGAQPLRNGSSERLSQMMERSSHEIALYSVALEPGGNRILEDLFKFRAVQMGPRQATENGRLEEWMNALLAGHAQRQPTWSRLSEVSAKDQGRKVWDQLARWWATEEVRRMHRVQVNDPERVALAAKYQLVTAYSGAVVLETAEQYQRHGLTPIEAAAAPSVPAVPEPGVVYLLLPAAMLALGRRARRKD